MAAVKICISKCKRTRQDANCGALCLMHWHSLEYIACMTLEKQCIRKCATYISDPCTKLDFPVVTSQQCCIAGQVFLQSSGHHSTVAKIFFCSGHCNAGVDTCSAVATAQELAVCWFQCSVCKVVPLFSLQGGNCGGKTNRSLTWLSLPGCHHNWTRLTKFDLVNKLIWSIVFLQQYLTDMSQGWFL